MKVIFLDIDGVLNTTETFIKQRKNYQTTGILNLEIDLFRVEYLKQIMDKTGAKIVLSSSWRHFFTKENNVVIPRTKKGLDLYNLFKQYDIEIYDITTKEYMKREEQINIWIGNHNDIDSFIIIDDESSMFKDLLDRLIKTSKVKDDEMLMNMDDCTGLCEEHISIAINKLNSKIKVKKR